MAQTQGGVGFTWNSVPHPLRQHTFITSARITPGVQVSLQDTDDHLNQTDAMIDHIVIETNRTAIQKKADISERNKNYVMMVTNMCDRYKYM